MANQKNFQIVNLTDKRQIIARSHGFYRLFGILVEENPLYGAGDAKDSALYGKPYISRPILGPNWSVCNDSNFGDLVGCEGDFIPCADKAICNLLERQAANFGLAYIYGVLRDAEDIGLHIMDHNPKTGTYDHRIYIDLVYFNKKRILITNGKDDQYYIPEYEFRSSRTSEAVDVIANYVKQYCDFFQKDSLRVVVRSFCKMPDSVPEDLKDFQKAVNNCIETLIKKDKSKK